TLPMDKREARRFIRKAVPLDMKIDIVDGISVCYLREAFELFPCPLKIVVNSELYKVLSSQHLRTFCFR
ncbi:unnamed protein product, partial [Rotaria magnacalcarata]